MHVELLRAQSPSDHAYEEACEVCGERFVVESIRAQVCDGFMALGGRDGLICRACVEILGRRNPERFPPLHEFEEAIRRFPGPIWASDEEVEATEQEDPARYRAVLEANRVERAAG